ncbi:helix-turn-helix domain-containing protein [Ferrimicrobium sp.]|uniref:helix-turn-helix domain-containing protein n=1 Tax=Ferrimicrobium sp. TaxID=2926050 RepID=UPI00344BB109
MTHTTPSIDQTLSEPRSQSPVGILLDIDEAATALRISRSRLFQLVGSGELQSVKLGRRRLFRRCDLEAFASGLATTPIANRSRGRVSGARR